MWTYVLEAAAVGVCSVVSGAVLVYFCCPSMLIKLMFQFYRSSCGMQVKFIGDADSIFCYAEKGKKRPDKSSILFIHGYTASKDQWISSFKNLPSDYHLIALDMPGHGASSTPPDNQDLSINFAMTTVKKFAGMVGLTEKPFHIVGASLGGCIVGMFTANYPHLVERVTMICPAMKCPVDSDFSQQVEQAIELGADQIQMEHCRLLPATPHELQLMVDSCVYSKFSVNKQILKGFMELRSQKNEYYLRLFRSLASDDNVTLLERNCHRITVPSQLIWGEHDQIVHPSGAEVLKRSLPNCQDVTILERCGHSVDLDRPGACAKAILKFRGDLESAKK